MVLVLNICFCNADGDARRCRLRLHTASCNCCTSPAECLVQHSTETCNSNLTLHMLLCNCWQSAAVQLLAAQSAQGEPAFTIHVLLLLLLAPHYCCNWPCRTLLLLLQAQLLTPHQLTLLPLLLLRLLLLLPGAPRALDCAAVDEPQLRSIPLRLRHKPAAEMKRTARHTVCGVHRKVRWTTAVQACCCGGAV
jgi:hypothetical protein